MNKINRILLIILMLLISSFISCNHEDSVNNNEQDYSNEGSVLDDNIKNDDTVFTNFELVTTSKNNSYYTKIEAGKYLGLDLPDEIGCYYREITTFEDFSNLVQYPNLINEDTFKNNFVLVVKRVTFGYIADIGFKDYSAQEHTISLDSYYISQGTDELKTIFDYMLVPRNRPLSNDEYEGTDEDYSVAGKLQIVETTKCYYNTGVISSNKSDLTEFAIYFKNIDLANEYLLSNGYDQLSNYGFDDSSVLLMCIDIKVEDFDSNKKSCYLGFKDFNTNGTDIYITLERYIVNEYYGNNDGYSFYCVSIPNSLICRDIAKEPNVHILVQDNLMKIIEKE